jgi:hypothetical protein
MAISCVDWYKIPPIVDTEDVNRPTAPRTRSPDFVHIFNDIHARWGLLAVHIMTCVFIALPPYKMHGHSYIAMIADKAIQ